MPIEDNYSIVSGLSDMPQVFSTSIMKKEESSPMITMHSDRRLSTNAMVENDFCSADTQRLKTDYLAAQEVLNTPHHFRRVCPCCFGRMSSYIVLVT